MAPPSPFSKLQSKLPPSFGGALGSWLVRSSQALTSRSLNSSTVEAGMAPFARWQLRSWLRSAVY